MIEDKSRLLELPRGWTWTTLEFIRVNNSRAIVPSKTPDIMYELYSVPSFEKGKPEIVLGKDIGSNKQIVEKETVLLCKINPRINRVWVVGDFSPYQKIASTEWIPFFKQEAINPKYLCFFMRNNDFRLFLSSNVSGVGGSLMRVRPATFSQYPFPLAPFNEQGRIVSRVEELFSVLDAGVESLRKVKAQLKRYRQAVLKYAFEGKLTEEWRKTHKNQIESVQKLLENGKDSKSSQQVSSSGMDEEWAKVKLETCSNLITKGESPRWQGFNYIDEGVIFIRSENVLWGALELSNAVKIPEEFHNKLKRSQLKAGDVLINLVGASIGRCGIVPPFIKTANINQAVAVIRTNDALLPSFLIYLLLSPRIQKEIQSSKVETARPNIRLQDLRQLAIPLPPIPEQRKIVEEIELRFYTSQEVENTIEQGSRQADRLRQSILKSAFEGKLVPQDPADEPAEKLLERIKKDRARQMSKEGTNKIKTSKETSKEVGLMRYVE